MDFDKCFASLELTSKLMLLDQDCLVSMNGKPVKNKLQ